MKLGEYWDYNPRLSVTHHCLLSTLLSTMGLRRGQESSSRPPSGNQSTSTGKAFKRQLHSMALVLWQELGHICLHLVISLGCFASHRKVCGELCARENITAVVFHNCIDHSATHFKMTSSNTELPLITRKQNESFSSTIRNVSPVLH